MKAKVLLLAIYLSLPSKAGMGRPALIGRGFFPVDVIHIGTDGKVRERRSTMSFSILLIPKENGGPKLYCWFHGGFNGYNMRRAVLKDKRFSCHHKERSARQPNVVSTDENFAQGELNGTTVSLTSFRFERKTRFLSPRASFAYRESLRSDAVPVRFGLKWEDRPF